MNTFSVFLLRFQVTNKENLSKAKNEYLYTSRKAHATSPAVTLDHIPSIHHKYSPFHHKYSNFNISLSQNENVSIK